MSSRSAAARTPPATPRRPFAYTLHGERIEDPYHWLEGSAAPEQERKQDGSAWTPPLRQSEAQRGNEEPKPDAPEGASGEHWTPERGTEHDR